MYLLAATLALAGPADLLAQARAAEREGWPVQERALCTRLVQAHPDSPQAQVCGDRLRALEALSEDGDLLGYQRLEQARRGALPPQALVPLLESESDELARQVALWLDKAPHQSAVYAGLERRRRRLAGVSGLSVALLGLLSWPLGRPTWAERPRVRGVGIWSAICVPSLGLVQAYGQLSPRIWALLPVGAAVFLLAAGPAATLRGLPRVLWGLLSGLGALGSTFLVLWWAELLHWVGL